MQLLCYLDGRIVPVSKQNLPLPRPSISRCLKLQLKTDNTGNKFDSDKPRWELVPPEITALVDLFTRGAKKYGDRNWEKGMSWGRIFGALMRHAWLWMAGQEYDEETGAHHMVAVAWNALILYVYTVRKVGIDDRHTTTQKTESLCKVIGGPEIQAANPALGPRY